MARFSSTDISPMGGHPKGGHISSRYPAASGGIVRDRVLHNLVDLPQLDPSERFGSAEHFERFVNFGVRLGKGQPSRPSDGGLGSGLPSGPATVPAADSSTRISTAAGETTM